MKIYLFTLSFPFGTGETYLEEEMNVVGLHSELELVIVPMYNLGERRLLPENVSVDTSFAELIIQNHERKIWPVLRHFGSIFKALLSIRPLSLSGMRDVSGFVHYGLLVKKWAASSQITKGDLFYTYWFERITYGLSLFIRSNPEIRLISRAHRFDVYDEYRKHGFIPFRRETFETIGKVYSISEDGQSYIKHKYGFEDKIRLSRLGVKDRGLGPEPSDDLITLVSCSAINRMKRVNLIADLVASFAELNPELMIAWIHFGEGELRPELEEKIKNPSNNLTITLQGQVQNKELMNFYESNPVYALINLSDSEGIPVSMMEAISFGIPILATDVGGVRELVVETTGRLLPGDFENKEAISKLDEVISDKTLRAGARKFYLSNFNSVTNYNKFYKSILKPTNA